MSLIQQERIVANISQTESATAGTSNLPVLAGFELAPCQQDTEGPGYFEVFASMTGTGIGLTNLIVIAVILWGGRKLHKATFYCICNLAVADMMAGMLLLWIFGLQKVVLPFRTPEAELVQKSIWTTTVWSSIFSQLVIAVDRYCYVTKGARGEGGASRSRHCEKWGNKKRKRLVKVGIALTWLVPIVTFVVPVAAGWNCLDACSCVAQSNSSSGVFFMVCSPIEYCSQVNPPFSKGSMLYLGMTLIFIPIIPCVLYAKIYYYVSLSSHKLKPASSTYLSRNSDAAYNSADYQVSGPKSLLSPSDVSTNDGNQSTTCDAGRKTRQPSWKKRVFVSRLLSKNARSRNRESRYSQEGNLSNRSGAMHGNKAAFLKRSRRRDMRLLRTLIIILALLLVSTVPLGLLFIVTFAETDKRYVQAAKVLLTTSLLNSMINPWIYFWRFPEMRKAIRNIFCGCCRTGTKNRRRNQLDINPSSGRRQDDSRVNQYVTGASDKGPRLLGPLGSKTEGSATKEPTSSSNSAF
uniref:Sphingosine 1-phosphate receptor 2-like n=1 Tax=Phallusia mammillata TaxID=59560 RepID=A0A6F9DQX0_9ASCI|nr:sphingosine 1-phosphate receptor 2-like [Phallusia mammillata]